jgi:hypothetical protein
MTNESRPLAIRRCEDPECWCRNPKWNQFKGTPMALRNRLNMHVVKTEKQSNGNKETDIRK